MKSSNQSQDKSQHKNPSQNQDPQRQQEQEDQRRGRDDASSASAVNFTEHSSISNRLSYCRTSEFFGSVSTFTSPS